MLKVLALNRAFVNGPKSLDPAHSYPSEVPVRHFYLDFGHNLNSRTVVQYGKTRGFGNFQPGANFHLAYIFESMHRACGATNHDPKNHINPPDPVDPPQSSKPQ